MCLFIRLKQMALRRIRRRIRELHRLDCISSHKFMECWLFLIDQLVSTPLEVLKQKPLVTGSDLISLGANPSPIFKKLLDELFDRQLAGEFPDKNSAVSAAKQLLDKYHA